MDSAQSIAEKTPPVALEATLDGLRVLLINQNNTDAVDSLMKKYYIPFDLTFDESDKVPGEKPFIAFQYNRVGDNKYRSPWTNNIYPKQDESSTSTAKLMNENIRNLEKSFNEVWDSYKNLYYGHDSIGSVYLKEPSSSQSSGTGNNTSNAANSEKPVSFHGCFCIRKRSEGIGSWDSVSVVTADEPTDKDCTYHVDTYVRVVMIPELEDSRGFSNGTSTDISLLMSKENVCTTCPMFPDKIPVNVQHIDNIGTIIEDNEMEIRSVMEQVYIPKNYETLVALRKLPQPKQQANPVMNMMMDSGMLKKRLQQQHDEDKQSIVLESTGDGSIETEINSATSVTAAKKNPSGIPKGVNPLMASAMNSKILLKKRQQQQDEN